MLTIRNDVIVMKITTKIENNLKIICYISPKSSNAYQIRLIDHLPTNIPHQQHITGNFPVHSKNIRSAR